MSDIQNVRDAIPQLADKLNEVSDYQLFNCLCTMLLSAGEGLGESVQIKTKIKRVKHE